MAHGILKAPLLGPHFDCDRMNEPERIEAYIDVLDTYKPRGFSRLVREGERIFRQMWRGAESERSDAWGGADAWKDDVESLLTDWARRVERHDYISFGAFPCSGDVGFMIDAESAIADADHVTDYGSRDCEEEPDGFRGLLVTISDHGNVSAYEVSARKRRELFAVV